MKRKPTAATSREFFQFLKPSGAPGDATAGSGRNQDLLRGETGGGYTVSQQEKKKPALIGAGWLYPSPLKRLGDGGRYKR